MVFFDAHIHLYPYFDPDWLYDSLYGHAARLAPGATVAAALMLRANQPQWPDILKPGGNAARWRISQTYSPFCVRMSAGTRHILVVAARQVAACERLEALGLFGSEEIPDGLPLRESIARLRAAGMLPMLAWGLGKWLFKRRAIVWETLTKEEGKDLFVCDSALRPGGWPLPPAMRWASERRRLIYGSDPLPRRKGEEQVAGRYATILDGEIDPGCPADSLRTLLLDDRVARRPAGHRHGLADTLKRLR